MKKEESKREVFSTRLNPDLIKKLKHVAVDEEKNLNELLEEAVEMLLKSRSKK